MKSTTLTKIAADIDTHLRRMEATPHINVRSSTVQGTLRFYQAHARVAGRYVAVKYVSYQGWSHLSKADALRYLQALDAGLNDKHFQLLREAWERIE